MRKDYDQTEWIDRVIDESSGEVLVEGTPIDETNMNNIENGIKISHLDIGSLVLFLMQQGTLNQKEIEKFQKQRLLQGKETIVNLEKNNGYFRTAEPFKTVALDVKSFPQINAPNYDVLLTATSSDDIGKVGELIAYDKTQNGFKVKMTGTAKTVSFLWTLLNPNV